MVFTSGIVDEELTSLVGVSQYCLSGSPAGVEPGALVGGGGVDTLLGFEESDLPSGRALRGLSWGGLTLSACQDRAPVWCGAWLGVLFVNWIVDASIFRCLYAV